MPYFGVKLSVFALCLFEEAVTEVSAETVAKEMAENVTEEEAETEIINVKAAETEEVVKR